MTNDANAGDLIAILRIRGHGDHPMRGLVTIGRDPHADGGLTIEVDGDPLVSKSHLCIDIDQGDLIITDLGSSNGTYVHHGAGETAVPSDRWIPIPGDAEIEFGDQRMTIELARPALSPDPEDTDDDATIEYAPSAVPTAGHIACVQCQRELPPGSKFCDGCGTPVMPTTAPAPDPVFQPEPVGSVERTVVIPPGGFVPAHPPPLQPAGGLMFVDPLAASSSKGGVAKFVLLTIVALVVVGLVVYGLVTVFDGGDDSSAGDRGDAQTVPTEVETDGDVIAFG